MKHHFVKEGVHLEDHATAFEPHVYRAREDGDLSTCSYCGSLTATEFLGCLHIEGMHFSGCDWKYGWPHKFYVRGPGIKHGKFYTVHMRDQPPSVFARWNDLALPLLGVALKRHGTANLIWFSQRGFQASGVSGGQLSDDEMRLLELEGISPFRVTPSVDLLARAREFLEPHGTDDPGSEK